jgi:hypothetical protein
MLPGGALKGHVAVLGSGSDASVCTTCFVVFANIHPAAYQCCCMWDLLGRCRSIAALHSLLLSLPCTCTCCCPVPAAAAADLVGGVASVTLGDEEARTRGTQKSVLERKGPPTFPIVVEMRDRTAWVAHDTSDSVDTLLKTKIPKVQVSFEVGVKARGWVRVCSLG